MSAKPYIPIPVSAARDIAVRYHKQVVVIVAEDQLHGQIHVTTYGDTPTDKIRAAELGPVLNTAAGGFMPAAQTFEDFRDVATLKGHTDAMAAVLQSVVKTCSRRHREQDATLRADAIKALTEAGYTEPSSATP